MKKTVKLLALVLALSFFALMASGAAPAGRQAPGSYGPEDFESGGYIYENILGDTIYFLYVTNHTDDAVAVKGTAVARDTSGAELGTDDMRIEILGPGETSLGLFYFDDVSGADTVEYELEYSSSYYSPILADLEVEQTVSENHITLLVTNTGDISAQFVEAYALFFDAEGEVTGYSSRYIGDNDSEIKPGYTLSGQLDFNGKSYDHAEVYLVGRSNGRATQVTDKVTDDDFTLTEYSLENGYGDTYWILVVENGSEYDVEVTVNATAYDREDNVLGAGKSSIDVVGPGQTSLCYLYFTDVEDMASVRYQLFYDTDLYYDDVLYGLSAQTNISGRDVDVSVTNNGSDPAEFVEAYVLFFNDADELVYADYAYFTDDDYEIKCGDTITKQLSAYVSFSYVEVYLSGRHSNL